jgi:hypothetical protein
MESHLETNEIGANDLPPKIFLSHASEDKERFVEPFAKRLFGNGVYVWFDKWEMKPGDKLVDKIFNHGFKDAKATLIVLSSTSINKPWIKEELDYAVVSRISNGMKLIPIRIDDCEVPEALKTTIWIDIKDVNNYDNEFARIVDSIYDHNTRPEIGLPPAYIQKPLIRINKLSLLDTSIFKRSCDHILTKDSTLVEPEELFKDDDLTLDQLSDSIEILESKGYFLVHRHASIAKKFNGFYEITRLGFEVYAENYYPEFKRITADCIVQIVNNGVTGSQQLRQVCGAPRVAVDFVIQMLIDNDCILASEYANGEYSIYEVRAKLRRALA